MFRSAFATVVLAALGLASGTATAAVGRTAGTFDVSNSGAANYFIPIWTPPGPAGIQPKMALTYDSRGGSGPLGPGWSVSGLSSINRCNKTFAQDSAPAAVTLTYSDAFCIDGKRLRLTSSTNLATYGQDGTTYQTEIADFSNVIAHGTAGNGPAYFTVLGKNGLTYEYGKDGNSQILPSGTTTASAWYLSKVIDRSNNRMTITYLAPGATLSGTTMPATISWTPSSSGASTYNYTMQFNYTANVPQGSIAGYVAGTPLLNQTRLDNIAINNSAGTTIKKYVLTYGTSPTTSRYRLTQVTECADSAGSNCLAPTTIAHQDGQAGVASSAMTAVGSAVALGRNYDLNGDGLRDLIYSSGSVTYVALASATGFGTPIAFPVASTDVSLIGDLLGTGADGVLANNNGTYWYYTLSGNSFSGSATGVARVAGEILLDTDGNGLPDFVRLNNVLDVNGIYHFSFQTRLNTSTNGTIQFGSATNSNEIYSCSNCNILLYHPAQFSTGKLRSWDFNGDGREDIAMMVQTLIQTYSRSFFPILSNGTTFTASLASGPTPNSSAVPYVLDWNSDGCSDAVWNSRVIISGCNGSSPTGFVVPGTLLTMLDWNSDGRTDVLVANGSTIGVYLSTGSFVSTLLSTSIPYTSSCAYFTTDADGDGLDDLGCWSQAGPNPVTYYLHNAAGQPADLVSSITDGFGISVSPTYVALTRGSYTKGTGATYPEQDTQRSLYVVSQVNTSDGIGGQYTQTYTYEGARQHLQGRGFLGFQVRKVVDSRNGLVRKTYSQSSFPLSGAVYQDDLFQSNGTTLISRLTSTLTYSVLDSTSYNQRYFPYASQTVATRYEVGGPKNGQLITTTTNNFSFDGYGNATNVATTVTDNDTGSPYSGLSWTSTTATDFSPNPGTWCVGLPTERRVTNSAPSVPSIMRTVRFTPDYSNCRASQKITEPTSGLYAVTETYGFDGFGNINSIAVAGAGMATRTTTVDWGSTGQFPMTITNPLNQPTTRTYNFDFGLLASESDPNGITTTSLQYDSFGRKYRENRPDGTRTEWSYNDCSTSGGCLIGSHALTLAYSVYNADSSVLTDGTTYFDQFDRPLIDKKRMLGGGYDRNEMRYDSLGRVQQQAMPCTWTAVTTACPYWTTYSYDSLNRTTGSTRPISAGNTSPQTTNISYQGRTVVTTDPQSKITTKILTVAGTLGRSQDHNGYYQNFLYDAFGSVLSITDSASNALFSASYVYGIDAFQTGTTDMDRGTWGYTPNALGEVTAMTDANSASFTMTYDALSRVSTRAVAGESTITFTWGSNAALDEIGRLKSMSVAGGPSESYTYDGLGRLTNRQIVSDATYDYGYSYNATTGLLHTLTYPTSTSGYRLTLQYAYQNGFLNQVKDANAGTAFWTANAANPRGQVTQESLGNGLVTNKSFDAVTGWISSIQCGISSGACAQNHSYLFDLVGNVTQRQNNNLGLTENFYYDNLYRLDYSQLNGATNLDVSYDALGNITARSDVAGGAAWTYDSVHKHQMRQAGSPSLTYTYDANGNAVARNGLAITWNKYNFPTVINGNGESTTLSYDANQRRWRQVYVRGSTTETTHYVGDLLEKVTVGSVTDYRYYIHANGEAVAIMSRNTAGTNSTRYVLRDHQGSIVKITDASGAAVVSESFTAFGSRRNPATWSGIPTNGEQIASAGITREGYTGHDALGGLGLNHMNGRVQDAITGRFLSADPYITEPGNTQNYNRYSYVNNNPLSYTDPSGYAQMPALRRPYDGGVEEVITTAPRFRSSLEDWMADWQSRSDLVASTINFAATYRVVPLRRAARSSPAAAPAQVGETGSTGGGNDEGKCTFAEFVRDFGNAIRTSIYELPNISIALEFQGAFGLDSNGEYSQYSFSLGVNSLLQGFAQTQGSSSLQGSGDIAVLSSGFNLGYSSRAIGTGVGQVQTTTGYAYVGPGVSAGIERGAGSAEGSLPTSAAPRSLGRLNAGIGLALGYMQGQATEYTGATDALFGLIDRPGEYSGCGGKF